MAELRKRNRLGYRGPACRGARTRSCATVRGRSRGAWSSREDCWMPWSKSDRSAQSTLAEHRGADLRHRCFVDFHHDHIDEHFGFGPIEIVNELLD